MPTHSEQICIQKTEISLKDKVPKVRMSSLVLLIFRNRDLAWKRTKLDKLNFLATKTIFPNAVFSS